MKGLLMYEMFKENMATILIEILGYGLFGILVFEWVYSKIDKRFFDGNEERDGKFPVFRRTDLKNWSRLSFYPGAFFFLPLRMALVIADMLMICLVLKILTFGHDFSKGSIKNGIRKTMVTKVVKYNAYIWTFLCGHFTWYEKVDFDYSEYLGPDYKNQYREVVQIPTMISNHVSWIDSQILFKYFKIAFIMDQGFKKIPIFGTLCRVLDSVFINVRGTADAREKMIEDIKHRQEIIENTGEHTQLIIFPEGGTTNGTGILNYKKGAFMSERTLKPVCLVFDTDNNAFSAAFDILPLFPLIILTLCKCCMNVRVLELPPFQPNDYLFEHHAAKGKERWEIIAWATREIMSKSSGLQTSEQTLKEKVTYEKYMHGEAENYVYEMVDTVDKA